ncbi:MAG TPA: leucine-rich repeat protein [Firmicutes bacterium]|nr:leucine-rich repeat protein [Bacillota bacterium]
MQKTVRRSASLLFVLTLAAAIVIPTVADPISQITGGSADSGNSGSDQAAAAENYALSEDVSGVGEPNGEDLVRIIVEVNTPSLLEYANEKGITVAEAMSTSEGVRTLKKIESLSESAEKALSPYIVEKEFSYNAVLSGFSATIRYKNLSKFEEDPRVERVTLSDTYEEPQAITENQVNVDGSTGIFDSTVVDYDGTGTVVAVLDTGTDYTHEVFDMELDDTQTAITKDDVASVAASLAATSLSAANDESIDEDNLYLTTKLPYAYDYADGDDNVYPAEAHGTHVAGIIAGKSDRIRGVAPGAQIATFKVFPDSGDGAPTDAILAALNDAVILGVDAINMSLGSSCGFTREADGDVTNDYYDRVNEAGICLVVAASNDYSSAYGSANGNTNLASNPDSGTVGSPGSYAASLAVASISGVKTPYFLLDDGSEVYFRESRKLGQEEENDFVAGMLGDENEGSFEFVVIPGVGYEANYTGYDVRGKIAVVRRGGNSFEQKVAIAQDMGAVGVIIYNNVSGMLNMSVGTRDYIPSCLISMDYGNRLVEQGTGTIRLSKDYLAGPFMSDFSSWGVLPNLTLSPDITAHGGEITSSYPGGNEYDTISGTSMAAPNLAGALILVRQYVRDMDETLSMPEMRDLSYSLMMSTATIANNEYGNPYSPRKQGAGLADIQKSVSTKAYLTVDGSNKPKLSLGDDPDRTGVYTLEFNITNLSGEALSYDLDPVVFTETMSSDGRTVAELAYLLDAEYNYSVTPASNSIASLSGNHLSLGGYSSAKITVTLTLTDASKDYINANFVNGMYVEGYVRLVSRNADDIGLNLPYLAFFGDWSDAPMLDVTAYEVGASQEDSSVLEEDKLIADVYATLPMAGFASQDNNGNPTTGAWGMGAYAYILPQGYSTPATVERHASLTSSEDGAYMLYSISAGLLRGAKRVEMQIADSVTGEVIWTKTGYNGRKSHSSGGEQSGGYIQVEFDVRELGLANNSVYTFSMECFLDWGDGNQGNRNTFSFDFTIDNEKPQMLDTYVKDEDGSKEIEFNIYDNHYLQGIAVYTYSQTDAGGNPIDLTPITDGVLPIYDGEFNSSTRVTLNATPYWSTIAENGYRLYVQVYDYARNMTSATIELGQCDDLQLDKTRDARDNYTIDINGTVDLAQYVRTYANVDGTYSENYWTQPLVWESADDSVAVVGSYDYDNVNNPYNVNEKNFGLVTGVGTGTTQITVHPYGNEEETLTFNITVTGETAEPRVTGLSLSERSLVLERGEEKEISVYVEPYNLAQLDPELLAGLKFTWSSTNPEALRVTPDEDDPTHATVKALSSGVSASVSVSVEGSRAYASCSVSIKQEFEVDGVYLRSYTGRGDENGIVDIPADLGVSYIYPMAFFDNDYIKGIRIPEGVMYIMRAGIYGCENLEWVELPSTLEQVQTFGLAWNPNLKTVYGLENVTSIGSRAFINDTSLVLGPDDLSSTTFIQNMAFYGCDSITSLNLSKVGVVGEAAFAFCEGLTDLVIPANTTLETSAFQSCTSLENVTIYSENIGDAAFAFCTSLESVTFAGDVDTIGIQAFYGCTSLENVRFLRTAYRIDSLAFGLCTSLTEFTLPAGLEILGSQPFAGTAIENMTISKDARITQTDVGAFNSSSIMSFTVESGNKYFASQDGVLYDKTKYKLVAYPAGKQATTFTVPSSVRVIGSNAFAAVESVGTVNLNRVEVIEDYAFYDFGYDEYEISGTSFRLLGFGGNVSGYDNVRVIGDYAFANASISTLPVSQSTTSIGDYAFAYTPHINGNATISSGDSRVPGGLLLPDSLTYLGEGAFLYNGYLVFTYNSQTLQVAMSDLSSSYTGIIAVQFGEGLTEVGDAAFSYNANLAAIIDFGSLTAIAPSMFEGCAELSSVTLPDTIRTIGLGAFANCTSLEEIKLPEGLTEIAQAVFAGTALTQIDLPSTVTAIGESAFEGVAISSVDLTNVTTIGARAFYGTLLTEVSSDSVISVGDEAFTSDSAAAGESVSSRLASVSFPNAESIGARAFANCASLTSVQLPAVKTIGAEAFSGCASLATLNVDAAETVGSSAFAGTQALTGISLPNVQSIGALAFSGSSVTALELPASLSSVAEQAFAGATKLASVSVAAENPLYLSDNGVLYRRTGSYNYVTLVAYPEGKQDASFTARDRTIRIGAYAFANNPYVESVTLPVHVRVIGAAAFYGCTALEQIELQSATAPTLESYAYTLADGTSENVYNNFKTALDAQNRPELTIVVPSNHTGYDLYIWEQYFGAVGEGGITVSDTARPISSVLDFMDRVLALPAPADITEADREELTVLQRIYNTLDSTQRNFVLNGYGDDHTNYYDILTAAINALPSQTVDPEPGPGPEDPSGPNVGLIVGLSVAGGVIVLAGVGAAMFFIVRKKRRGE